jgi:hypothetical protein
MCLGRYKVKNENIVPPQGIGVRCPNCANIFTIYRIATDIELIPLDDTSAGTSYEAPPAYEEPARTQPSYAAPEPSAVTTEEPVFQPKPSIFEPGPPPSYEEQEVGVRTTPSEEVFGAAAAAVPTTREAAVQLSPELKKMHDKAKRLARVLVKDIVLYHGDKVEKGLKDGNLVDLIGDEIKKSWQYYKGETPEEVLSSTNYFKEALNQILARGKKIFT